MLQSHILLMPYLFEAYGWVYLEVMAAGAIAMVCDSPIQQEILADGDAGILIRPEAEVMTFALLKLLAHSEEMLPLAAQGMGPGKECRPAEQCRRALERGGVGGEEALHWRQSIRSKSQNSALTVNYRKFCL